MSLNELRISADAYLVCLAHVLSTESTEVMGVLLGDVSIFLPLYVCMHIIEYFISVVLFRNFDHISCFPPEYSYGGGMGLSILSFLYHSIDIC